MHPLSSIAIMIAASLLTSCASMAGQPKPQTSQNSGQLAPKRTPTQEQRDYAAQTAASIPSQSSSVPTKPSKAGTHVTQSTQVEKVIGSKPVIGDDSELRN